MKNFDEKIREKLFDAEMPVSDGIWDAIEMNLERKDKRPRVWFLLLTLLIGVPSLYFSLYYTAEGNTILTDSSSEYQSTDDIRNNLQGHDLLLNSESDADENTAASAELIEPINDIGSVNYNSINSMYRNSAPRSLSFQIASGNRDRNLLSEEFNTRDIAISQNTTDVSLNTISDLAFLSNYNSVESEETEGIRLPRMFTSKSECPEFKAKWLGWYGYTQLVSSYPFEKLSSEGFEMTDLINQRLETESGLPSFALEAGLGYDFVNGLFVQGGIQYNQINMKFKHVQEDLIRTETSIMIDTIFGPGGDPVKINRDTTIVPIYGEQITRATNTFKMIDIPVSVGYRYPVNNRLRLTASAGLALNIRSYSKGYMVDYDGDPYKYGGENDDMFRSRVGLSYTGSLGMETVLSERLYATAGLNLRYYSSKFNLENNPVDQRFLNLGISAGIKYRI